MHLIRGPFAIARVDKIACEAIRQVVGALGGLEGVERNILLVDTDVKS
jgi:hypothetical protein